MGGWNALGAAAFHNRFCGGSVPLDHNWEWLHIQGAQIGGLTDANNLMAGTFAANSAMIPYEAADWGMVPGKADGQIWARFRAPTAPPVAEVHWGTPSVSPWLPSFLHGMEPPRIPGAVQSPGVRAPAGASSGGQRAKSRQPKR